MELDNLSCDESYLIPWNSISLVTYVKTVHRLTVLFYWQKQSFVQAVDELLTKLDEYVGFADLVRFGHWPFFRLILCCFVYFFEVNWAPMAKHDCFCCGTCFCLVGQYHSVEKTQVSQLYAFSQRRVG